MQPRLYLRPKVTLEHLTPDTLNGLSRAASIFYKYQQPFAVTCTSEGRLKSGLLSPDEQVFGVEKPECSATLILQECRIELGQDWKIEKKATYWRFEFDPKQLQGTPL